MNEIMKRFLIVFAAVLLLFSACGGGEKNYFTDLSKGETFLSLLAFEDGSQKGYTVISDVLYAGSDTSSRYKMVFYLPDGWDDTYPIFLDRYVPQEGPAWTAYQGAPVAEAALKEGNMIVVLVAYDEWTAIPDILLAEFFLKENDAVLPGDSRQILTTAYFEFE